MPDTDGVGAARSTEDRAEFPKEETFAVDFLLNQFLELEGIGFAVGVADGDVMVLGIEDGAFDVVGDFLKRSLAATDFLDGEVHAVGIGDQDRLDAEEVAEEGGAGLDAAGVLQISEGADGRPLIVVELDPIELIGDFVEGFAIFAEGGGINADQALAHAGVERIDDADMGGFVLRHDFVGDVEAAFDRAGKGAGAADVKDVVSFGDPFFEGFFENVVLDLDGVDAFLLLAHQIIEFFLGIFPPGKIGVVVFIVDGQSHVEIVKVILSAEFIAEIAGGIEQDFDFVHMFSLLYGKSHWHYTRVDLISLAYFSNTVFISFFSYQKKSGYHRHKREDTAYFSAWRIL